MRTASNAKTFALAYRIYIGKALRLCRKHLGKTRSDIADTSILNRTEVTMIEKGKAPINITDLTSFCESVGVRPSALVRSAHDAATDNWSAGKFERTVRSSLEPGTWEPSEKAFEWTSD